MAEPFIAEIRMVGFKFAPRDWALCDGQILAINQNQALFALLGTTYGGDGRVSYGLPDFRGRSPVSYGRSAHINVEYALGQQAGSEGVRLDLGTMPNHYHGVRVQNAPASQASPVGGVPATGTLGNYAPGQAKTPMHDTAATGGAQAHENMQPFAVINFCIALHGLFPARN